jgi:hypothetical protein
LYPNIPLPLPQSNIAKTLSLAQTMADPRTVVNPFTMNDSRMRRNTKGNKWVATKDDHPVAQRPSPSKPITFKSQPSHYQSQATAIIEERGEDQTLYSEPEPVTLKATICDAADLKDLPNTYVQLPSVRSWSSLRSSVYEGEEDVSPRTVTPYKKVSLQSEVSSFHSDYAPQRDNSVSIVDPSDFHSTEEARNESNATVFPSFPSIIRRPKEDADHTRGTQSTAKFTGILDTARKIYDVGPKGEGQKLWSTYKKARKDKLHPADVTQEPLKQMSAPRRPSEGLCAHPPTRPAPSQDRLPLRVAMPPEGMRKESEVSRLSLEVPVRIERYMEQVANCERPLPKVSMLKAAPKSKATATKPLPALPGSRPIHNAPAKSLPALPHMHSAPKRRPSKSKQSTSQRGDASTNPPYPTHQDPTPLPKPTHNLKPSQWWKSLADFTSESHLPSDHKTTISRPRPFTALQNGLTANLAAEHGGVGGPGAATHRTNTPATHLNYSSTGKSERALGKQKRTPHSPSYMPKHWREKLHVDRRGSSDDLSFACVGVGEPGPSSVRQVTSGNGSGCGSEGGMVPKPLFTGRGRDTQFYGFYGEVLEEYRGSDSR